MKRLLILAVLAVSACAVPAVRETLPVFHGKSIDFAKSYLGVPTRQYVIDGDDIYEWDNSRVEIYERPRADVGFGWGSGGSYGAGIGVPIGDYETEVYRQECNIKMIVRRGIVQGHEMSGDSNGCALYAKRLKPLTESIQP